MHTEVGRWGNSLAVRIPAQDARALGIKEGDTVKVTVQKVPRGKVDISSAPVFSIPGLQCEDLKDAIADAMWDELQDKKRRR